MQRLFIEHLVIQLCSYAIEWLEGNNARYMPLGLVRDGHTWATKMKERTKNHTLDELLLHSCTIADIFTPQKGGSRRHSPLGVAREGIYSGDILVVTCLRSSWCPMWYPDLCDIDKHNRLMWKSCESYMFYASHEQVTKVESKLARCCKAIQVGTALHSAHNLGSVCSCSLATCRPLS